MARDEVLVSTDWAERRLDDPSLVFVEVDEDTRAHAQSHIPGAVALDWRKDLQDPQRRGFLSGPALAALLSERGISSDALIVLYGGSHNWFAAYAYWYLRYYGHEQVRLLDGGREKWEKERRPLTAKPTTRPATHFPASALSAVNESIRSGREEVLTAAESILAGAGEPGAPEPSTNASVDSSTSAPPPGAGPLPALVDVRSPDEYAGIISTPAHLPHEGSRQRGHIPGAINVPWDSLLAADGTFLSDGELRRIYRRAGLDIADDRRIIAYCRIGERSSHTWFALHELLGLPDVANYDGSWVEYGSLIGAPVRSGATP